MPGDGLELEWEDDSDQSCSGLFAGEQVPMAAEIDLDDVARVQSLSESLARTRAATVAGGGNRRPRELADEEDDGCHSMLKRATPRTLCVKYVVPCLPGSLLMATTVR